MALFLLLRLVRLLSVAPSKGLLATYLALTLTRIEGLVMAPFVVMYGASGLSMMRRGAVAIVPAFFIVILNYLAAGSILSNSSQAKAFWAGLAREAYFWNAPAGTKLRAIIAEAVYAPAVLVWQLLLSIRDDRVLGISAGILLAAAGYIALRKRAAVAGHLHWRPLYLLTWYSAVTWFAYKTIYFTPRVRSFAATFAVYDYQSIWYFVPLSLLVALALQFTLSSAGNRFLTRAAPGICLVTILWFRAGATFPATTASEDVHCLVAPADAVYVAQNDDEFAYRHRLKIVVLDGLVTGRRHSDGESYLSVLADGRLIEYLAGLSPGFVRVGTKRLLTSALVADDRVNTLRSQPVVPLCGMGMWYQLKPDHFGAYPLRVSSRTPR